MGNNPDWLPAGWKVSVRVRSCGRKDKYYINPTNGFKFNSKPDVLRYLKNGGKNHKHKEQNMVDKHNDVDIKLTVADKLPPGWIKEIRTKRKGCKTRRDPYYIDPISKRQFRSMQEVFRYLETTDLGKIDSKPYNKVQASEELGDHSQSSSAGTNGKRSSKRLINKRGDKTITEHKRLKSEPELATGSKGTVINNVDVPEDNRLEQRATEDISQAVELSVKIQLVNRVEECKDKKRKNKNSPDIEVDKNVDGDESLESGSIGTGMEYKAGDLPNKLPLVITTEEHESRTNQDKRLTANNAKGNIIEEQTLQSGSERFPMKIIYLPETNSLEQREKEDDSMANALQDTPQQVNTKDENVACQYKRRKWNSKWMNSLPRRSSKRLALAVVDSSLAVNLGNQAGAEARLLGEPEISPAAEEIRKAGVEATLLGEPEIIPTEEIKNQNSSKKHSTKCRRENQANNKQKDAVTLPLGELSCLEEYEGVGADSKNYENHEKQLDSSLNDLLMDPCIEFAIKTLTGAIPIEDINKVKDCKSSSHTSYNEISGSSSVLPSGDLWSDPCFEFAVRTLTGDIPMEGSSHSEISFEQPLSSSEASKFNCLTLSNFRFDDFCPTSYSYSHFNATENPTSRQLGIQIPPLPYNKNGSSRLC